MANAGQEPCDSCAGLVQQCRARRSLCPHPPEDRAAQALAMETQGTLCKHIGCPTPEEQGAHAAYKKVPGLMHGECRAFHTNREKKLFGKKHNSQLQSSRKKYTQSSAHAAALTDNVAVRRTPKDAQAALHSIQRKTLRTQKKNR
ncbi:hypothetical protein NDU88_001551 [Pleurodeles waltl]|uniref:Uncharacterized protein n=1 Tax=Pleurodeles waltl TaxID=8319 RepID=A0AAV7NG29_PLEWA|nr:hypothetical protein NDU88_001551 [Pleurodeles waltl]